MPCGTTSTRSGRAPGGSRVAVARRLAIGLVGWGLVLLWVSSAAHGAAHSDENQTAFASQCGSGSSDSIWLVSTRHLPCSSLRRYELPPKISHFCGGVWRPATCEELLAVSPARTCIFVHGNRIESHEAPALGLNLYRRLHGNCAHAPLRFVIWSWPSDQIRGPLRDARTKAAMARCEAFGFARFLQTLPSDEPTSVIGFSYGAQVILGATHLVAGGQLERHAVPTQMSDVRPAVVLAASAVDVHWLRPGGELSQAWQGISHLTLISNQNDPVLKHFRLATGQHQSLALGVTGLAARYTPVPLVQRDFSGVLGRSHSWERHLEVPSILRVIREGAELELY